MEGLHFETEMENSKFIGAINESERRIKGLSQTTVNEGKKIDGAFQHIGEFAKDLIGPLSAVAVAAKLGQMAQDAYEFERAYGMAMREVQTISKAVQEDIEGISQSIVDMAANGPDGAIKLAKAYYQIVSAGYDGAEGLKLLEISSKAATAGIADTTTAADGLTSVLNAWGLGVEKANLVADVMFTTVRLGKTTFSELASGIAQVAPLAASNNVEFEQIFAALASITKQGTPTSQALTQIRSSLVNMNKVLGDGWADAMTYQEGLNLIAEKAGGSQNKLKELIPDVEGVNAVLALTGQKAAGAADDLNETAKAAGAMETAYGRMMLEADNRWSQVHNKWTREVRELGQAMKDESGNMANFMDALLSKGADVDPNMSIYGIADKIKALRVMGGSLLGSYLKGGLMSESVVREQYDQYVKTITEYAKQGLSQQQMSLGDILGIKDKDERLTKLNEFLVSMKKAEQDLGNTVFQNDEQQNAALKIRGELWGEVEARAKEAIKAIEGAGSGGGGETKARTLKTMLDEIKTQQDALGTGSMKEDIAILARISALQQEVLAYYNKIREARKIEPVTAIKPISGKDSLGGVQTITKEQAKQELQGDKLLKQSKARTGEAQKQAEATKEQNDQYTRQTAFFESLTDGLSDASELLGAMSYAIGEFDSTLGESVGKMADLANNAANMFANYASGNFVGAIASGIGVLGNIIGLAKSDKEDPTSKAIERVNILLEKQSVILSNLAGNNYFDLAAKQFEDYGKVIDLNNSKLRQSYIYSKEAYELWVKAKDGGAKIDMLQFLKQQGYSEIDTEGWSPQNFIDAYTEGSIGLDNQQIEWVQAIVELQKQRAELLQETFRTALGFDASDVSDSILQGIEDGLKLSENNLGGFAETFGELMKKALMQSVIDSMNLDLTNTFLPEYQKAMSDLILTDEERANLESIYRTMIEKGQIDVDNIESITARYGSFSKSSAPTGITASASAEAVSAMVGQAMAMRVDLKEQGVHLVNLRELGLQQVNILDASLFQLMRIGKNTDNLEQLKPIKDTLDSMDRTLKEKL